MRWLIPGAILVLAAGVVIGYLSRSPADRAATPVAAPQAATVSPSGGPTVPVSPPAEIPFIQPGVSCNAAIASLGNPAARGQTGMTWTTRDFEAEITINSDCRITTYGVSTSYGHQAATKDGIVLGKDTLATADEKLKSRLARGSEVVQAGEGRWYGKIVLREQGDPPYEVVYTGWAGLDQNRSLGALNRDIVFDDLRTLLITSYEVNMTAPLRH